MSQTGPRLRTCGLRDLEQVIELEKASFPVGPFTREDFAYYLLVAGRGFIVAVQDGSVLGYVIAVRLGREGSIHSIAVSPQSRRKGIGEMLMKAALDALGSETRRVHLLVAADNEGAIRLYRRLSFRETGRIVRSYYPDGSDAVEMERSQ
jgi:ribosomal-protein-alanine N-acetyltransferase